MKHCLSLFLVTLLFAACKSEKDRMIETIAKAEQDLRADSLGIINDKKARALVQLYADFANTYRDDTLSAEYLFKAGEVSTGIGDFFQAIQYYRQCTEKVYYAKRPVAFFLMGFIYENHLNDTGNAKRIYEEFLQKFPGHPLEKDVQFSLKHLGKSPEELIREFQENQNNQLNDSTALS
jgi:TolA-binding protein